MSETLIVAALMGVVLLVGSLFVESTRAELKRRQVWVALATLDKAASAYYEATQTWPTPESNPEDSADPVVALLQTQAAARDVLQDIPSILRVSLKDETWTVQDAWGHRLRCLTAKSKSTVDCEAVVANGGKPIFISANVDGEFGDNGATAADNLRSDELPR